MFNQQIHGSKRSLRSVEDFTNRMQVSHMAQMQNMFVPPATKLTLLGRLARRRRPRASCAARSCSSARRSARAVTRRLLPDNQMQDLHLERFVPGAAGDGLIK